MIARPRPADVIMLETARGALDTMGVAAPDSETLADILACALHAPHPTVLSVQAAPVQMPRSNMTTGGLWRVEGTAGIGMELPAGVALAEAHGADDGRPATFSVFAKLIQPPLLWPGIVQVPPDMREELARRYPWRTEAVVYGSGLARLLPDRTRLPDILGLYDVDPQRTVIWMEDVQWHPDPSCSDGVFAEAARWLGRLAGSQPVREGWPDFDEERAAGKLRFYVCGVGAQVLVPSLRG